MNTFQNLVDNGIDPHTAQSMLDDYSKKIGTMNGIYEIADITYDFTERGRDVTLKCSLCGREIQRMMIAGRNKWSELIKSCPCQKVEKAEQERLIAEKISKDKKDLILSRIGEVHGNYEIISVDGMDSNPQYTLRCVECGAEIKTSATTFHKRTDFHCGKHYIQPVKFDESYIGRKNNFLKVIGITRTEKNRKLFVCECECGNVRLVEPALWEQGNVKSCGCKHSELVQIANTKHGECKSRLYGVWCGMNQRCYNPNSSGYENYGGRGIKICPEWLGEHGFENFAKWAYPAGYDENAERGECTIERKDVNGNYEPDNCTWATSYQQQRNKRTNVFVTINGETKIISDWQKELGVSAVRVKRIANGEPDIRKKREKKYDEFIKFRLSKNEMEHLKKQSSIYGVSISEYVRMLIAQNVQERKQISDL